MEKKTLSQKAFDILNANYNDPDKADRELDELLKQKNNEMPLEEIQNWHVRKGEW